MFNFLYTAVSWVLLQWHHLFTTLGLNKDGGLNWALSIIFLVITARLLLFRLFIKQVHYQRHMQEMQPKITALREKYKNDKAEMQRQMMKLQQEQGFNPLAGCLPMLLQIPVFIGLFHVLRHLSNSVHRVKGDPHLSLYSFTPDETLSAAKAKLFGAPLAASLHDSPSKIHDLLGGDVTSTRIVTLILVVVSAAATFLTQRLVMSRATTVPTGTAATVQKLMIVFIPISVLFSGFIFPLGVLLYWFTSNVWTLGQQAYINKFHPHTPTEAQPAGELGKTLAPKPGQRPARAKGATTSLVKPTESDEPADSADQAPPQPARNTPRPGQRPQRPGGNRPPAKRTSQAKKRR
ncbi:MAG: YidC/Oxa1 family rane protein insertase [Pseudonocardiales bacterium]|nr:YidC/Oxa1 family rane protein insertase [Pseudonocardiales bacterium]